MSDESNIKAPAMVTIPAAEYGSMKSGALRYYGQAESAGREAAGVRLAVVAPWLWIESTCVVRPRRAWPRT